MWHCLLRCVKSFQLWSLWMELLRGNKSYWAMQGGFTFDLWKVEWPWTMLKSSFMCYPLSLDTEHFFFEKINRWTWTYWWFFGRLFHLRFSFFNLVFLRGIWIIRTRSDEDIMGGRIYSQWRASPDRIRHYSEGSWGWDGWTVGAQTKAVHHLECVTVIIWVRRMDTSLGDIRKWTKPTG